MSSNIPPTLDELLQERRDLTRQAEEAEAQGRHLTAKMYRHAASVVTASIEARTAQ